VTAPEVQPQLWPSRVTQRHLRGLQARCHSLEGKARVTGRRGDKARAARARAAVLAAGGTPLAR